MDYENYKFNNSNFFKNNNIYIEQMNCIQISNVNMQSSLKNRNIGINCENEYLETILKSE